MAAFTVYPTPHPVASIRSASNKCGLVALLILLYSLDTTAHTPLLSAPLDRMCMPHRRIMSISFTVQHPICSRADSTCGIPLLNHMHTTPLQPHFCACGASHAHQSRVPPLLLKVPSAAALTEVTVYHRFTPHPSSPNRAHVLHPPRTSLSISLLLSSSSPGVRSTPSSGMQYVQRRLQRSVTLIRRYVCLRLR